MNTLNKQMNKWHKWSLELIKMHKISNNYNSKYNK